MRSAGSGSKGDRFYRWAFIAIHADHDDDGDEPGTGEHLLLIRRNDTTGELAYHHCYTPPQVPLTALVWVAGQRWRIEESFQTGKGLTGLDQHQVRRWTSWHRWSTLAMLAHAFLVVATADQRDHTPTPAGLIALTVNEFRHLFDALLLAPNTPSTTCCTAPWRQTRHRQPAALLPLAPKTPSPSPHLPLPAAPTTMITIYGCSTRRLVSISAYERRCSPHRSPHMGELPL